MSLLLRILLYSLLALILACAATWLISTFFTDTSQFARAIVCTASDFRDHLKFPSRPIHRAGPVFHFTEPTAEQQRRYADLFERVDFVSRSGRVRREWADFMHWTDTVAFIVIKDDVLLYEGYFNGYTRESTVTSFSVAKSFASALVGAAVSTVYAVFSSKRGILRAIRSAWHERSHIRDVTYAAADGAVPRQRLEQLAAATRRQWETGAEVVAIYTSAATADPEAAAELEEALAGRRKGMETFSASLRPGLDASRAADILMALCSPEVYAALVHRSGWTGEEYQAWLAGVLQRELLEPQ